MYAPSWVCLVLLTASACHGRPNWPSGVLENKNVKIPQQRPVEVQRYLIEAKDAVKSLVHGAREEALEHLAAMKRKHMEIVRKNFYTAMEKRLFRLDSLKPQTSWRQKPCRESILSCFHIPKYYLSRPLYSKINYINPQYNCNSLPYNSYLFQECVRRSLLSTHATVKPTSEIQRTTTFTPLLKSTDDQYFHANEDLSYKKILESVQSTVSDSSSTETIFLKPSLKEIGSFEKLDSQKTNIKLENEILQFEDIDKSHTPIKTYPTSTQTSIAYETESTNVETTPKFEILSNARNDPEPSAPSVQKLASSTISAISNGLDNSLSTIYFKYLDMPDEHITLPPPISSTILIEPKENIQIEESSSENMHKVSTYAKGTLMSTTPLSSDQYSTRYISQNKMLTETKSTRTVSETTVNQNEFYITQVPVTEINLGREEPQNVVTFPDETIIVKSSTEKLLTKTPQDIKPHILETISSTSSTIQNRYNEENNNIETLNSPKQNAESNQKSSTNIDSTQLYITDEESIVQTSSEMPETEDPQYKEIAVLNAVNIEPTTTPQSLEVDIALKTGEIDLNTETTTKLENGPISGEDVTNYSTIKGNDVGTVQTTRHENEDPQYKEIAMLNPVNVELTTTSQSLEVDIALKTGEIDLNTETTTKLENGPISGEDVTNYSTIKGNDVGTVQTTRHENEDPQYKEIAMLNPVNVEPTTTSQSLEVDIALKTGEIDLNTETTTKLENDPISGEDVTNNLKGDTNYSTIKGNDVGTVQTTLHENEDVPSVYDLGHKPFLDVQERLLEQTLSYSSQTDLKYPPTTSLYNYPEYSREVTTLLTPTGSDLNADDIARSSDELKLAHKEDVTDSTPNLEETTLDITTIDAAYKESRIVDEMVDTTENLEVTDVTSRYEITDKPLTLSNNVNSRSSIVPIARNSDDNTFVSRRTENSPGGILKFTTEIESTSIDSTASDIGTSSTPADLTLNGEPHMVDSEKELQLQRVKRSEVKLTEQLEDSSKSKTNTSDVYITPTYYASTILELLPVIREGYKNNAFNDEDKKVVRSIFGEMKPWLDEESVRNTKESATDLMMDEETSRTEGVGNYSDYDYTESQEAVSAENDRRLKRSKNLQLLRTIVGHLPKHLQREASQSRKIRSSGPQPVSEAAAILALLAENGEGVQLDRADDDDDDEYEYYEDDSDYEDLYQDEYEDDNPSFTELIKLARKHRERKAMQ